ncbi:MAG: helix-turn-helix domain-containing protein [Clostridiales bacterium]|nr:helix-turn-helix domain-containing protein [Clostridiales bacterium]
MIEVLREINTLWDHHYQFLTEYRVRKSTELLSGSLTISEIAGLCGYNQPGNYIAKFKSIIGCTPAQYRKHYE